MADHTTRGDIYVRVIKKLPNGQVVMINKVAKAKKGTS